jgi:hypothetical protein
MPATLLLLPLAMQAVQPLENLEALHQQMEAAADTALRPLDPRLRLRDCPEAVNIVVGPRVITATCAVVGWRVYGVPIQASFAGTTTSDPAIRRGDPVTLRIPGRGFAVVLRAVALEDAVIGARIRLRRASGPTTPLIGIVTGPGEAAPVG